jgi:tRNA A-37 threonylcarbamoyl transferase component Bud32
VVVAYFAGCRYCGQLAAEILLVLLFGVTIVLPYTPWAKYAARPVALWWSLYQLVVHVLFTINYIFILAKFDEVASCLNLAADGTYYVFYALLLYATVVADSVYWRKRGALLLSDKLGERIDLPGLMLEDTEEGRVSLKILRSQDLDLHELLGTGAMADVYRAIWRGTNVAVKKFKVSKNAAEDMKTSLLQEGKLLSELRHPNVLLLLGICIEPDFIGIITEFMAQGSLFDLLHLSKPRVSSDTQSSATLSLTKRKDNGGEDFAAKNPRIFLRILKDVGRGMVFLHSSNVIHRDLKSHNLLLGK